METGDRVITSGEDQHLKIFNVLDMSVTFQAKYESSITSFSIDSTSKVLGIGL